MCLDGSSRIKSFTHRWTPDHEGPRGWALGKSRYQFEDLELIPQGVVQPSRLHSGFRPDRFRSWPCFAFDDDFLVDGGILVASLCRWLGADGGLITDSWPRGFHSVSSWHQALDAPSVPSARFSGLGRGNFHSPASFFLPFRSCMFWRDQWHSFPQFGQVLVCLCLKRAQ